VQAVPNYDAVGAGFSRDFGATGSFHAAPKPRGSKRRNAFFIVIDGRPVC
jgi:hypothetical protein